ncbi:MAG: aspartate aminotransferase family protein [Clostridiales bacterium]|nr:acetylornithine/succinylornithine family transaminase [Clostridiales bacterium]PWM42598.1 MAG: aspartate aminotransferase family protein [Clostridiales bacterium]
MTSEEIKKLDEESFMPTYGRFNAVLCSGKNATGVGCDGKEYIDFGSGIGVNSLGWADEGWVNAVSKQAATLQHTSNLYYNPASAVFASELLRASGYGAVFLGNSGAEANECAIKLARKYSVEKYGKDRCEILTLQNSFHGRTVTTLAATGQDVFHNYFFPFTEGFAYAEPNMESVREHLTEHTCAVMIEFIQGEGGVLPLDPQFVTELAALCKEKNLLLLADEVQTGVGRTGTFYCCEQYGVRPDVLTSAKGLGGGLPIGACLCTKELGDVMGRSAHGSTFGANPVVCAGALEVIRRVSQPAFLDEVKEKGACLRERLEKMKGVAQVRGMGMMLGVVPEKGTSAALAAACVENGLLILTAKSLLRLLPPLTITREEMDKGLAILEKVLAAAE